MLTIVSRRKVASERRRSPFTSLPPSRSTDAKRCLLTWIHSLRQLSGRTPARRRDLTSWLCRLPGL